MDLNNKTVLVNSLQINNMLERRIGLIYGAGIEGVDLYEKTKKKERIVGFVDSYRGGDGRKILGKQIYGLERFGLIDDSCFVIIASDKFAKEMLNYAIAKGLRPGNNLFVWDELNLYQHNDDTRKYIEHNKKFWPNDRNINRVNTVLIPFINRHDMSAVRYAYFGNYFADKFNAKIETYSHMGISMENASDVITDMYKSFGVNRFIEEELNNCQKKEVDAVYNDIWGKINTWEDWDNITVRGLLLGRSFIRFFLRTEIPPYNCKDCIMERFMKKCLKTVIFWDDYFAKNNVKVLIQCDGPNWDAILSNISCARGIPTYIIQASTLIKSSVDFSFGKEYPYYKSFWDSLTNNEKEKGRKWAKNRLDALIRGEINNRGNDDIPYRKANKRKKRLLSQENKIKILICPHIFEEDIWECGKQIFDDNPFSWLCHLGELSNRYNKYEWYLKKHPSSSQRDNIIIDEFLNRFKNIIELPADASPIQLKEDGLEYALTIYGSIGHEYPLFGVDVINAGNNPHEAFDFDWNPSSKEEYDELIDSLNSLPKKNNIEEIYQFYAIHDFFYDRVYSGWQKKFFINPVLKNECIEYGNMKKYGTQLYSLFVEECTKQRHDELLHIVDLLISECDDWNPCFFYKRSVNSYG